MIVARRPPGVAAAFHATSFFQREIGAGPVGGATSPSAILG
jgi:hypothetical protein